MATRTQSCKLIRCSLRTCDPATVTGGPGPVTVGQKVTRSLGVEVRARVTLRSPGRRRERHPDLLSVIERRLRPGRPPPSPPPRGLLNQDSNLWGCSGRHLRPCHGGPPPDEAVWVCRSRSPVTAVTRHMASRRASHTAHTAPRRACCLCVRGAVQQRHRLKGTAGGLLRALGRSAQNKQRRAGAAGRR